MNDRHQDSTRQHRIQIRVLFSRERNTLKLEHTPPPPQAHKLRWAFNTLHGPSTSVFVVDASCYNYNDAAQMKIDVLSQMLTFSVR